MGELDQILDSVPETAGSYSPAAEALDAPLNEDAFGDTALNAEHVLGHTGVRDLLLGKLSKNILKASEAAPDPDKAGLSGLGHVESLVNKHSTDVSEHVDDIFREKKKQIVEPEPIAAQEHQEIVDHINRLANDPSSLINNLSEATRTLHAVAPQIASNVQQTATRAIQFLASKANPPDPDVLGEKSQASPTEIAQFHRYLSVVETPRIALAQIKRGTITPETVETLQTVYPKLYDHMKQQLISQLNPSLPYQTKLAISTFLGEPIVSSLSPDHIANLQSAFDAAPAPPPPGKSPGKALSKLDISGRNSLAPKDA